jgi:quinolinate synthase
MSSKTLEDYASLSQEEVFAGIEKIKRELGSKLVILGHHYQREDVIRFADHRGDSLGLAKMAADSPEVEYIVFCGVNFMAESAAIVGRSGQRVFLPDLGAGCMLADMADVDDVALAWNQIGKYRDMDKVVPITYVNSSSELKAFIGKNGGTCCTSSNAVKAFEWALNKGDMVLFCPDGNLGRNCANTLEISHDLAPVWDPTLEQGGLDQDQIKNATAILWSGYCHVHTQFTVSQIDDARQKWPKAKIIVHPECDEFVVNAADGSGSTEYIKTQVENSEPGSEFIIATEVQMVDRLARQNPEKMVIPLKRSMCPNMFKITPIKLLYTLEQLPEVNEITVSDKIEANARLSLDRMLEIGR